MSMKKQHVLALALVTSMAVSCSKKADLPGNDLSATVFAERNATSKKTTDEVGTAETVMVTTLAGGTFGTRDGQGADAQFSGINDMTEDAACNLYVTEGKRIRKITPSVLVTTLSLTRSNFDEPAIGGNST